MDHKIFFHNFLVSNSFKPSPWLSTKGASKMIEFGENPFSNAAAYTIGLKAEPGCLLAWVTLLNSLDLKSKPPTKAFTSPVKGSRAIIPPFTLGYCFNFHSLFSFLTKIISPTL